MTGKLECVTSKHSVPPQKKTNCHPEIPILPSSIDSQRTVIQRAEGVNPVLAVHTSPARRISLINLFTQSLSNEILQSLPPLLNDSILGSAFTRWLYSPIYLLIQLLFTNHYSLLQEILQSLSLLLNDSMIGSAFTSWLYSPINSIPIH